MIYRKKHKESHKYTSEEIAEAIRKFQEKGGLIKKLPDQIVIPNKLVIPSRFMNQSCYEGIGSFDNLI